MIIIGIIGFANSTKKIIRQPSVIILEYSNRLKYARANYKVKCGQY